MKNSLYLLLLWLMCGPGASARERNAEEMVSAARSVLLSAAASAENTMHKAQRIAILNQQPLQMVLDKPHLAVVGQQSVGFAVIAKDTRHTAVWGYSDTPFSADDFAPSFLWLMESMDEAFAEASAQDQCLRACAQVAKVAEDADAETDITPIVEPLIKTHWYQKEPCNRLCPMVVSEGEEVRGVTGCVPTALAQFIYYYQQPTCGEGQGVITLTDEHGNTLQTLTADLSTMPWDFTDMLLDYSGDYTDEQALAVARLMQACGYICNAVYYSTQTAGTPLTPYSAAGDHIGFRSRELCNSGGVDIAEIISALDDGNPLFCSGFSHERGNGHAFLIDGYDSQQFLHVNFGWAGREDGYYALSDLNTYRLETADVLVASNIKKITLDALCYDLNPATHEASARPGGVGGDDDMTGYRKDYVVVPSIDYEGETYTLTTCAGGISYWANSVSFPATLQKITPGAIGFTKYLKYVVCHAPQPPEASGNFDNINAPNVFPAALFVPEESLDAYRTTEPWSNFSSIFPVEQLEDIRQVQVAEEMPVVYDLMGRVLSKRGATLPIRIEKGKKIR